MNRHLAAFVGCLILFLIGFGFFLGLKQADAVSTMNGDLHQVAINCANCHTLSNRDSAGGTMGIKESEEMSILFPDPDRDAGDPFPCEFCHRTAGGFPDTPNSNFDKQTGFNHTMMSYKVDAILRPVQVISQAPSGHPVISYTYPLDADTVDNDGDGEVDETELDGSGETYNPLLVCTNCHDRDLTVYPAHEFYDYGAGIYSTQARLLARTGALPLDPDPWDTTMVTKGSMAAWNSVGGHTPGTPAPIVDYELFPTETNQPFASNNFCLTCHDADGFPANPYAASEDSTYRIPGRAPYSVPLSGTVPDIKSLWDDMGHYIKTAYPGAILRPGDKIPCSVCHFSHYSPNNVSLVNNTVSDPDVFSSATFTNKLVCLRCHDENRDGASNLITGIPMLVNIYELIPPPEHEGRGIREHTLAGFSEINSCLAPFEINNPLNDGCHMSPHAPKADCGGCHIEENMGATGGYGDESRVAVKGKSDKRGGDDKAARGASQDYYNSHPVNISLDINVPDIIEIKQHYLSRPERNWPVDPVPLGVNNSVYCTTCHNTHGNTVTDTTNADSTFWVYANDDTTDDQAVLRMEYPMICLQCHNKIYIDDGQGGNRFLDNPHGGFSASQGDDSGVGMCNKCHSMHGRHPYTTDPTQLAYPLHYGMYGAYNTTWENLPDPDTGVYIDIKGYEYYKSRNSKLMQMPYQYELCGYCHGTEPPPTGDLDPRPPNVFFPHESNNYREDAFFLNSDWRQNPVRNNSTHPIDEGTNTPWGEPVNIRLRCSSCHNPHGSDNHVQLRSTIKIGVASLLETVKQVTGIKVNAYYDTAYDKWVYNRNTNDDQGDPSLTTDGMTQFCTACHTDLGDFYYDPDSYDTSLYQRHPMNVPVSRLNVTIYNFDQLVLQNKSTNPNDGEVFCLTCHYPHASPQLKLRKFQRTESCQLYCHVEIVAK